MAALIPAIHVFPSKQDVDARHKAGHDGGEAVHHQSWPRMTISFEMIEL
jgi:hypothetical protein